MHFWEKKNRTGWLNVATTVTTRKSNSCTTPRCILLITDFLTEDLCRSVWVWDVQVCDDHAELCEQCERKYQWTSEELIVRSFQWNISHSCVFQAHLELTRLFNMLTYSDVVPLRWWTEADPDQMVKWYVTQNIPCGYSPEPSTIFLIGWQGFTVW